MLPDPTSGLLSVSAVGPRRVWPLGTRYRPAAFLVFTFALEAALVLEVLREGTFGPVAALGLAFAAFVCISITLDAVPPRTQWVVFAALGLLLTPALAHAVVAGGRELYLLFEFAGLVLALIVLTPSPAAAFAGWLFLAPLLQLSARATSIGYWANNALYLAPPLLLALWTLTPSRGRRDRPQVRPIDLLPLAYLIVALVSLAMSSWAEETGYRSTANQLYQNVGIGVICYYFCAFAPGRNRLAHWFVGALLTGGLLVSTMAIVEKASGWTLWGDAPSETGRVQATLSSPGVLGAYLGAALAVATAVLLWNGPKPLRRLSLLLLPVALPALAFTVTRGPILATLVVLAAMIAFRRSGFRWVAAGAAILITSLLVVSWGKISSSSVYRERVVETRNVEGRLLIDKWSIKLFEARPVLGYGYGSFNAVKNAAQLSPGKLPLAAGKESTSHNTFLTILVELGAVGLALLVLPWLKISFEALKGVARRMTELPWLQIGCVGIVGTYVLTALTTDMRFFSIVPALPWMAVGMMRANVGIREGGAAPAGVAARGGVG
jgi:O-antigen ligase